MKIFLYLTSAIFLALAHGSNEDQGKRFNIYQEDNNFTQTRLNLVIQMLDSLVSLIDHIQTEGSKLTHNIFPIKNGSHNATENVSKHVGSFKLPLSFNSYFLPMNNRNIYKYSSVSVSKKTRMNPRKYSSVVENFSNEKDQRSNTTSKSGNYIVDMETKKVHDSRNISTNIAYDDGIEKSRNSSVSFFDDYDSSLVNNNEESEDNMLENNNQHVNGSNIFNAILPYITNHFDYENEVENNCEDDHTSSNEFNPENLNEVKNPTIYENFNEYDQENSIEYDHKNSTEFDDANLNKSIDEYYSTSENSNEVDSETYSSYDLTKSEDVGDYDPGNTNRYGHKILNKHELELMNKVENDTAYVLKDEELNLEVERNNSRLNNTEMQSTKEIDLDSEDIEQPASSSVSNNFYLFGEGLQDKLNLFELESLHNKIRERNNKVNEFVDSLDSRKEQMSRYAAEVYEIGSKVKAMHRLETENANINEHNATKYDIGQNILEARNKLNSLSKELKALENNKTEEEQTIHDEDKISQQNVFLNGSFVVPSLKQHKSIGENKTLMHEIIDKLKSIVRKENKFNDTSNLYMKNRTQFMSNKNGKTWNTFENFTSILKNLGNLHSMYDISSINKLKNETSIQLRKLQAMENYNISNVTNIDNHTVYTLFPDTLSDMEQIHVVHVDDDTTSEIESEEFDDVELIKESDLTQYEQQNNSELFNRMLVLLHKLREEEKEVMLLEKSIKKDYEKNLHMLNAQKQLNESAEVVQQMEEFANKCKKIKKYGEKIRKMVQMVEEQIISAKETMSSKGEIVNINEENDDDEQIKSTFTEMRELNNNYGEIIESIKSGWIRNSTDSVKKKEKWLTNILFEIEEINRSLSQFIDLQDVRQDIYKEDELKEFEEMQKRKISHMEAAERGDYNFKFDNKLYTFLKFVESLYEYTEELRNDMNNWLTLLLKDSPKSLNEDDAKSFIEEIEVLQDNFLKEISLIVNDIENILDLQDRLDSSLQLTNEIKSKLSLNNSYELLNQQAQELFDKITKNIALEEFPLNIMKKYGNEIIEVIDETSENFKSSITGSTNSNATEDVFNSLSPKFNTILEHGEDLVEIVDAFSRELYNIIYSANAEYRDKVSHNISFLPLLSSNNSVTVSLNASDYLEIPSELSSKLQEIDNLLQNIMEDGFKLVNNVHKKLHPHHLNFTDNSYLDVESSDTYFHNKNILVKGKKKKALSSTTLVIIFCSIVIIILLLVSLAVFLTKMYTKKSKTRTKNIRNNMCVPYIADLDTNSS